MSGRSNGLPAGPLLTGRATPGQPPSRVESPPPTHCTAVPSFDNLPTMTLTELRYIVAVARERHFGRAAEACFVSQPTLSVAIKKLVWEIGRAHV